MTGEHIQEHNIANNGRISQPAMNAELVQHQQVLEAIHKHLV